VRRWVLEYALRPRILPLMRVGFGREVRPLLSHLTRAACRSVDHFARCLLRVETEVFKATRREVTSPLRGPPVARRRLREIGLPAFWRCATARLNRRRELIGSVAHDLPTVGGQNRRAIDAHGRGCVM